MLEFRIGTIGFSYPGWKGPFYPDGTRPEGFLAAYAQAFDTVELDTTFHAVPRRDKVAAWASAVPQDFRFCVKTPREITHDTLLEEGISPMRDFLAIISELKEKLAIVLLQFPPIFDASRSGALERFLDRLPSDLRYAIEFRNRTWETAKTLKIFRDRQIAWVAADWLGTLRWPPVTTDFVYLRLRGEREKFPKDTHEQLDVSARLDWWSQQIGEATQKISTAWIFTANDYAGHAPATAKRLQKMAGIEKGHAAGQGILFDH